jgi:hypothetical protein
MPHLEDRSMDSIVSDSIRCGVRKGGYWGSNQGESGRKAKKCGAENGDPNLRSQPRLPGSVVGEASMRQVKKVDKITRVTVPW